ncbi:MAG: UbiD family decarboxylase [Desulfobacterales bacterium]|nr:UbiD family decarboxylase [Desulfobacterales bacterium]
MSFDDLRSFLEYLDGQGELVRTKVEVDPRFEIGAVCRMALDRNVPALYFSNVKGSSIPIVTNLVASRKRYAMALGSEPENLHTDWMRRVVKPIDPVLRNTLGILAAPYRHIMLHRNKRPNEPLPVALALGCDPVVHIASTAP